MNEPENRGPFYLPNGSVGEVLTPMNLSTQQIPRRITIPKLNGYTSGFGRLGTMKKFAPVRLQSGSVKRSRIGET